ncbi:retrovirus-related pol polyprotein from transposon TNT 1-94 [Tanacetum coccineum]|uniref:Retrovirus-related pol polyprotein from transposon TNT 1-94 n=1 Tax=Tanacetum coccineum TaxID=301880 RepID=A0ABQ4Z2G4_9ASTR
MKVLHTLHMDLCGPMRVQSINGKKYILVIMDDYSRFTWVKFLRSKDETPEFVIKFLKQIQVGLNKINRTLVEAAQTMLIFLKALMFMWAEAVATAFFGALCYLTNDIEDLGKLKATADIGIFVGYAPNRKACSPSSTTIDQDAPSTSHSPSSSVVQPPISHQGVTAGPTINDNPFAQADNIPFVNMFALKASSKESSSRDVIEPKNVKTAMDEAYWFEAMQEEIHKFDRLQV